MSMGTYVKKLRTRANVSQEFVAKQIGLSRPTYSLIESGKRDITVEEAKQLSQLFGVSLEDFLSETLPNNPQVKLEKKASGSLKKVNRQNEKVRISVPQEQIAKFKEVLLYILEQIGARQNVGEAVICKLLYFIDFDYYEKFEEQLIGARYIKNHFGPTPAAFKDIVAQMEKDGDLFQIKTKHYQYDQKKYLPLRKSRLGISDMFTAKEKELIDWEIERFKDFNATKMMEYSHNDVPWLGADHLQEIDYEAVFYRTPEFSVRTYEE